MTVNLTSAPCMKLKQKFSPYQPLVKRCLRKVFHNLRYTEFVFVQFYLERPLYGLSFLLTNSDLFPDMTGLSFTLTNFNLSQCYLYRLWFVTYSKVDRVLSGTSFTCNNFFCTDLILLWPNFIWNYFHLDLVSSKEVPTGPTKLYVVRIYLE